MRTGSLTAGVEMLLLVWLSSPAVFGNSAQDQSTRYGLPRELSIIRDERIDESSGIAASVLNHDCFWTHNDSGDSARIFLFNKKGETLATVEITGASSRDWEDIASFRIGGDSYVLVADAGDNGRGRNDCVLYVIKEPLIAGKSEGMKSLSVAPVWTIRFSYEDGPHDCEAVAVDSSDRTIYLASKEQEEAGIYAMPLPGEGANQSNVARKIAAVKMHYANAMDISPDGKRAVLLTYGDAYEFSRSEGETWGQAFARTPQTVTAPQRKQGESICYGIDGKALYLTSENDSQPLWEIPLR